MNFDTSSGIKLTPCQAHFKRITAENSKNIVNKCFALKQEKPLQFENKQRATRMSLLKM